MDNLEWNPVGAAFAGKTQKAKNVDIAKKFMENADKMQDYFEDSGFNIGSAHMPGGTAFKEAETSGGAQLVLAAGSKKSDKY